MLSYKKKPPEKSAGEVSFYYFQAAATLYSGGKSVKRRIKREEKELSSFYFFLDKNALRGCKDKLKEKEGVSSFCVFVLKTYKQRNGRKRRSIDVISSLYVFGSNTGHLAHVLLAVWIDLSCARTGLLAQTMHISTSANFDFTSFYQLIRSKNGFRDRKRQKFTNCLQIPAKTR